MDGFAEWARVKPMLLIETQGLPVTLMELLGTELAMSTTYHPQCNDRFFLWYSGTALGIHGGRHDVLPDVISSSSP